MIKVTLHANKTGRGRFLYLAIGLVFYVHAALAGSFRHLNVENGLSSRRVFQIEQDSLGFVWFFTYAGVDRYDGSEIRHYRLSENQHRGDHLLLSSTQMICDRNRNIWVLMKNGKIYSYDRSKDVFVLRINLAEYLSDSVIALNASMFDRDNRLWLCLASGLYYFDFESNQPVMVSDFSGEQVTAITQGGNHELFVGTSHHVYRLGKESGGFSTVLFPGIPDVRVESLLFHRDKLYAGTFSNGAYIVDLKKKETVSLVYFIPNIPVRAIAATHNDRILIGVDGSGFYSMDAGSNQLLQKYAADEDISTSLTGNTVCDIFVDRDNHIWVGTSTDGVSILDPDLSKVKTVRHELRNENSLGSSHVNVILEDSDGDLWYGTNNGISVYSARNNRWNHFLDEKGTSPVVLALCEDNGGNVWAGGFGTGVWRIDKRANRVQALEMRREGTSSGLSTPYIFSIYADGDDVWFGGIEGELTRYNIPAKTYAYYPVKCIGDIKAGKGNTLLFATCAGLAVFNKDNGRVAIINEFDNTRVNTPVRCLHVSSSGDIWLATDGKGLVRFHPETGDSEFFTLEDTYTANSILSVVEDDAKHIWFGSENGLYCLDPKSRLITNMNEYIGMNGAIYNANAIARKKNGDLVFGTAKGAVEFSPDFMLGGQDSVRLVFTDFMLSYKTMPAGEQGSPLQRAIDATSSIALRYTQNSFSFAFSSINFHYPHKVQYLCRLDGCESDWHETAGQVDYTNIGSGKYQFRLRAVNKYTKAIIDERNIEIIVNRPWWASVWAFAVYAGLAAVVAFFVQKYVRTQIEERNSREKINFFTNIAHDIRTPVTLIKAPLSELENESLSGHGRQALATAVRNTEKLFSLVTQLLDFQKADLPDIKMVMSKNELYSFMNEKIASFRIAAVQKDIALKMAADFEQLEVYFDRDKMNKIVDNLLSNAIKYTPAGGAVTVTLSNSRENWSAEVRDTGIGIPAADRKNIFKQFYRAGNAVNSKESGSGIGLLLTRKLVTLHGGEILFSSTGDKGSTFKIVIPVGKPFEKDRNTSAGEKALNMDVPHEKILLVEDNDDMRAYLKNSLIQEYQVTDMADGRQVVEQIAGINPDIVISDVLMPYLRGDEMCRMLKSSVETSHIPVILLTALSDKENIIKGLESGADDYITKPFDTAVLKARVRNILQNREKLRSAISSGIIPAEEINYANELDKEFMSKATAWIEKEMSNSEFSINEFCLAMGMSRSSFYNKIKTLTGHAPNDFIRIIRLNKARELLRQQKYNVSEVAVIVGFSDAKYFSTCFKKQFGISPSKIS